MSLVCAQSMQEGNEFALFFLSPLFSFSAALIKKSESEGNQGEWKFFSLANLQTVFKKCQWQNAVLTLTLLCRKVIEQHAYYKYFIEIFVACNCIIFKHIRKKSNTVLTAHIPTAISPYRSRSNNETNTPKIRPCLRGFRENGELRGYAVCAIYRSRIPKFVFLHFSIPKSVLHSSSSIPHLRGIKKFSVFEMGRGKGRCLLQASIFSVKYSVGSIFPFLSSSLKSKKKFMYK